MSTEELKHQRFSKILVAIDGSGISDYGLNLAIHIGERFSSKVDLIYVSPPAVPIVIPAQIYDPAMGGPILSPGSGWQTSKEELDKKSSKHDALVNERKKLVDSSGLSCEIISIESENVGGEIVNQASKGGYDLVVIGSRGLSGLQSLILGSVSKKVSRESKTSVLVVKTKVEGVLKILVGYDGSDEAKRALYSAAELGSKFNGEVNPIGVVSIPVSPEGMVIPESVSNWEKEMSNYVNEGVKFLKENGVTKCEGKTVESPDVTRGIIEEAFAGSYDLIAVGNKGYGRLKSFFLGSVTTGVADGAKTNVLIVR